MKLLRKKNGQWFTVSVAVGGMLLGATTINAAASETDVHSQEVNVSGEAPPENLSGDDEGQTLDQGSQVEGQEVFEAEEPTYIVEENLANDQANNSIIPSTYQTMLIFIARIPSYTSKITLETLQKFCFLTSYTVIVVL